MAQALGASLVKTPAYDEPAHIGAGLSYLVTGEFKVNLQHPPLLKELAALPLVLTGARWPMSGPEWAALGPRAEPSFQWQLGNAVLAVNEPGPVLFWSRLPMILLAAVLGWAVWAWGRRMLGETAALGALFVFVVDPTIIAHAALVTTDVGCAAFSVLFLLALHRYLSRRTPGRLLVCGLALGGALAAKFSAVVLLPLAGLLLLLGAWWVPPARPATAGWRLLHGAAALLGLGLVAALVVWATYLFTREPWLWVEGLRRVNADHDPAYPVYMAGRFAPHFPAYFLVAYLLKTPIAAIALAGLGVWAVSRRGAATPLDRVFLLGPPALIAVVHALLAANLGLRYLVPALPFLHLLAGAGLAALLARGWLARGVGVLLAAWLALAAVGIYPDHLSYFNEAACVPVAVRELGLDGGARCGPYWLDDSNVDWGQGLAQLAAWLAAHPSPLPLRLAYFGSVPPARYGVRAEPLDARVLAGPPPPGRYVVSAHIFARLQGALIERGDDGAWLLRARPTAIVGHALYVYDVTGSPG